MENSFYIKNEYYSKAHFEQALKFAINLSKGDSTTGRIVILVYTKKQYQLIQPLFSEKIIQQGALSLNGVVFKFYTLKTYTPPSYEDKRDIVVIVGISPSDIQKLEDEYKIKYFIYVPWLWRSVSPGLELTQQRK